PTRAGIVSGLAAGLGVVVLCFLMGWNLPLGLHPGFLGLLVNVAAVCGVSLFTKKVDKARLDEFEDFLAERE
ncbi:MAG: sodium:solute symporter family protein, partial [Deltaproteobacteria bacterium]|nr:sodium:solute symporter family protein [Deltaproteobacteria bacterium]